MLETEPSDARHGQMSLWLCHLLLCHLELLSPLAPTLFSVLFPSQPEVGFFSRGRPGCISKYMSLQKKKSFQEQWWKEPKNVLRRMNALGFESKQNIRRVNQKEGKEGERNRNVWSS